LNALNDAFAALAVDPARMLRNIDALQGLVFAEAASIYLADTIGRPSAHALLEQLTQQAVASGRPLFDVLRDAIQANPQLGANIDIDHLASLFDPVAACTPARKLAERQLQGLRDSAAELDSIHPF
jgi:3-carboxy-cis,cis-muconate cycloisomerase